MIVLFGKANQYSESDYAKSVCVFDFQGNLLIKHQFEEEIKGITSNPEHYFIITQSKIIKLDRKNAYGLRRHIQNFISFNEVNKTTYIAQSDYGYTILKIKER